jgi:hypothetical protein
MSRPKKAARLGEEHRGGRSPVWIIRDGEKRIRTGLPLTRRKEAEAQLAEYIANREKNEVSIEKASAARLKGIAAGFATTDLQKRAGEYTSDALRTLMRICRHGESEHARVAAAMALHAHGNPADLCARHGLAKSKTTERSPVDPR